MPASNNTSAVSTCPNTTAAARALTSPYRTNLFRKHTNIITKHLQHTSSSIPSGDIPIFRNNLRASVWPPSDAQYNMLFIFYGEHNCSNIRDSPKLTTQLTIVLGPTLPPASINSFIQLVSPLLWPSSSILTWLLHFSTAQPSGVFPFYIQGIANDIWQ